jgi:hypothetical protein
MVCALPSRLRFRLVVRIETRLRFSSVAPSGSCRPLWRGVSTDSLKFRPALPFYALQVGHPQNSLTAVSGVAHPQGRWPAAVFYPLGYPTPYGPGGDEVLVLSVVLFSFFSKFTFQFMIESVEDEQVGLFRACVQYHYKGFTDSFVFRSCIDRKTLQILNRY